jgi:molybdopterin-containing oxidoreductase family iron-sulfur binding subunit
MKRPPIDPDLLRDRLAAAQGKRYWRSLEELAADPAVAAMLQREFPDRAGEWHDPISRRRFLALMGASLALAGLNGCTRPPTGTILPYVRQPESIVPGKPLFYATTMPLCGFGYGLLVESHEGRPTKAEGNPQHPASLGATSVFGQAAILGLYDPDRSQTVSYRGRTRGWGDVVAVLRNRLHPRSGRGKGKGVAILSDTVGSPTLAAQRRAFLSEYPEAKWYQYEPVNGDDAAAGSVLAFGKRHHSYARLAGADVIVSLGADFLGVGPAQLASTREFSARRRVQEGKQGLAAGGAAGMNRLYVIEADLSITGAKADHRLALPPGMVEAFARILAATLGVPGAGSAEVKGDAESWVNSIASDLKQRKASTTVVLAGDALSPAAHATVAAINHHLGNAGSTVVYTEPVLADMPASMESLGTLVNAIDKGEIDTLIVLGGNPAYSAPADLPLAEVMARRLAKEPIDRWLAVHLGAYFDETARLCHWHIPEAHFLESWSDAVAFDGTASIVQPLIAPLYASHSAHEVLASLARRKSGPQNSESDYDDRPPHDLVRDHWREHAPAEAKSGFERFWQQSLHDGVIAGTQAKHAKPTLAKDLFEKPALKIEAARPGAKLTFALPADTGTPASTTYELVLAPDPAVHDGRFANNGWLQELPRPISRLTWDNAVLMSPATARKLGVGNRVGQWRGGEHGQSFADVVELDAGGRKIQAPVWVQPGHADGALTLSLGYGRTHAGRVGTPEGTPVGVNASLLRLTSAPWVLAGVKVAKVPGTHTLACVQAHHNMEGRDIVRSGTRAEFDKDRYFAQRGDHVGAGGELKQEDGRRRVELPSLYPNAHPYTGYKWGMAIDLTACTGCGACVVACQAENNSPVIGKEQVTRGRVMHWLRIDRYFETPAKKAEALDELHVHFQPVMCVHCENAPCEIVCPVAATAHGDEGTNDMVYNRCVGTRYCANNCPYKVRRFNFFQFSDYETPSLKLMHNPDVTVRTRGVMEKCSYCIQRISAARIEASKEMLDGDPKRRDRNGPDGEPRRDQGVEIPYIRDGEILTACQAACPAEAIVFGDLNDQASRVRHLHDSPLRYDLLGELGTRPRTGYLAELRNPNPELERK